MTAKVIVRFPGKPQCVITENDRVYCRRGVLTAYEFSDELVRLMAVPGARCRIEPLENVKGFRVYVTPTHGFRVIKGD